MGKPRMARMDDAAHGDTPTVGVSASPTSPPGARTRARFSRTASVNRWSEYRRLLRQACAEGYEIVPLEQWLEDDRGERVLIVRHDVDQCPGSALRMLAVERELGVRSTWYFRWRTARPRVVQAVLDAGGGVGLHYETLSRIVINERAAGRATVPEHQIDAGRRMLKRELTAFGVLFGPCRSACAHGDTRVPDVNNAVLLRDCDPHEYGIEFDANASMRSHDLAVWLTDRSRADGSWRDGLDAGAIIESHTSPVLLLTHPNNWISGAGLWWDRLASKVLPEPRLGAPRALRTGSDTPPVGI
jgi:hypothetical protein